MFKNLKKKLFFCFVLSLREKRKITEDKNKNKNAKKKVFSLFFFTLRRSDVTHTLTRALMFYVSLSLFLLPPMIFLFRDNEGEKSKFFLFRVYIKP